MTTKAHKLLTGADLHEPKGADAAAANKVYVSDGAGSGTWQKLTASQLQTTGNPFGGQLLHVRETQTNTTASSNPSYAGLVWETVPFNTSVTNEISGASLGSNQVTLTAGTYHFEFNISDAGGGYSRAYAKVYNVTDAADEWLSVAERSGSGGLFLSAPRIVVVGTKAYEIRIYPNSTLSVAGCSMGFTEIYGDLKVWKVA